MPIGKSEELSKLTSSVLQTEERFGVWNNRALLRLMSAGNYELLVKLSLAQRSEGRGSGLACEGYFCNVSRHEQGELIHSVVSSGDY